MADFDAGSIIGSLDVDRDPFTEGLDLAKRQAEEFENRGIKTSVDLDDERLQEELDAIRARMAELSDDGGFTIKPGVDDTEARTELDALRIRLDEITHPRDIEIKVDKSQISEAEADIEGIGKAADKASGSSGGGGGLGGVGMKGLLGLAVALAPALYPAAAAAVGFGAATAAGFAVAGTALGSFAIVAKSDWTDMTKGAKALGKAQAEMETATTTAQKAKAVRDLAQAQGDLVGPIGQASSAYANFLAQFDRVKQDTSGPVFGVMTQALNLAAKLLPTIEPLIESTAGALHNSVTEIGNALGGPGLGNFLKMVQTDIVPLMSDLTGGLVNFGGGIAKLFEAVNPLTLQLGSGLKSISQSFNDWTTSLANGGIQPFLDYLKQNGPLLSEMLKAIGGAVVHLAEGLAPLTGPALQFLTALGTAIQHIDIASLANAVGKLLIALIPLLPALVNLINDGLNVLVPVLLVLAPIIKAFGDGLAFLTSGVLGDIVTGLGLLAGAIWLVNTALAADPAVLLVTAIVAAIVGLIVVIGEIKDHWQAIVNFFRSMWNEVYGFFKKYGMDILMVLAPFIALPLLVVKNWNTISKFFSDLWDDVTGFFQDHWKLILQVLTDVILWPLAIIKHWDGITKFFKDLWGDVEKVFSDAWSAIIHGLETAWTSIENFFKALPGRIVAFFTQAPTWLLNAGKDVIHGMLTGITTAWDDVGAWARGIPNDVENWWTDAIDWLEQIGEDLIQGLWNGITAVWDHMTHWISDAAGGVEKILKDVWSIASPSQVMHQIGLYFGQGLHNGIIESMTPIPGTVEKFSKDIQNAMSTKVAGFGFSYTGSVNATAVEQAAAIGVLGKQMAELTLAVKEIPTATGDAVGNKIAKKFEAATKAGVQKTIQAGRQG